jgi:hypothetical protein
MQETHDPSSEDRERMERYLQWRQRTERAERRRWRFRGAAIIVALGVVAVGLLTWLPPGSRDTRTPVALTGGQDSPSADVAAPSESARPEPATGPAIERVPAAKRPAAPVRRTTRAGARTHLAAAETTPGEPRPSEPSGEAVTSDTPPSSTPPPQVDQSSVVIAPGNSAAAVAIDKPACRQRVVDCVGGWLKGEAQEFRDGTRREVENFRAGFDRIGRGLSSFGSKLRRSD